MKKFKFIICSMIAALALTGCGGAKKAGVLPSGGKTVDLSTEEGVAALKSNLEKTTEAYKNLEIYALGLKSETKGLNVDAKGSVYGLNIDASLKGFNLDLEAKLGKDGEPAEGEEFAPVKGQFGISNFAGTLKASVKGNLPLDEDADPVALDLSETLKIEKSKADVYLLGNKVYVDASDKGLRKTLDNASGVVNDVLENLPEGLVPAEISAVSIDVNKLVDQWFGKERKCYFEYDPEDQLTTSIFSIFESIEAPDDEDVAEVAAVINELGFVKFVTYSDGRFGFQADVTKEALAKFAETEEDVAEVLNYFDKLDVHGCALFNKNGLLVEASVSADVKAHIVVAEEEEEPEGGELHEGALARREAAQPDVDLVINGKVSEFLSLQYNDEVKFSIPSEDELAKYVAGKLPNFD